MAMTTRSSSAADLTDSSGKTRETSANIRGNAPIKRLIKASAQKTTTMPVAAIGNASPARTLAMPALTNPTSKFIRKHSPCSLIRKGATNATIRKVPSSGHLMSSKTPTQACKITREEKESTNNLSSATEWLMRRGPYFALTIATKGKQVSVKNIPSPSRAVYCVPCSVGSMNPSSPLRLCRASREGREERLSHARRPRLESPRAQRREDWTG